MQASIVILHRDDGLLRAMSNLLGSEGYLVLAVAGADALPDAIGRATPPVVVVLDEETAGPDWLPPVSRSPAGIAWIVLTWDGKPSSPPGVISIRKPFRAQELLDALSAAIARLATPTR